MKIQRTPNGFYKRVGSGSDFETDVCPTCHVDFVRIQSLYDNPEPKEMTLWANRRQSMEATLYKCPYCSKHYMYWETGDYDYFHLMEVTVT